MNAYTAAADVVVFVHMAYVLFVVLGLVAVVTGYLWGWQWVRNRSFRLLHLGMIGIVVVESLMAITCPLTTLEDYLRNAGGHTVTEGSFVGRLAHEVIFFDVSPQFFTLIYCAFGGLVLAALLLVPINRKTSVDRRTTND
jgi:hypothetical protein